MTRGGLGGVAVAVGAALMLHVPAAPQRGGGPPRFPSTQQFEASAEAQKHVAAARTIAGTDLLAETILNTHPGIYQDTLADMETIRRSPNGPNPLLYGRERAARYWAMMAECARARVVALERALPGA
jgi:hypothetical protein